MPGPRRRRSPGRGSRSTLPGPRRRRSPGRGGRSALPGPRRTGLRPGRREARGRAHRSRPYIGGSSPYLASGASSPLRARRERPPTSRPRAAPYEHGLYKIYEACRPDFRPPRGRWSAGAGTATPPWLPRRRAAPHGGCGYKRGSCDDYTLPGEVIRGRQSLQRVRPDSLCSFIWPPGGKFMLLILPPGGKLIIQDQVSGRIAYAPIFALR